MTEAIATAAPEIVLVRFQFTNRNLIPIGIRKIEKNENQLEEKRQLTGVKPGEHTEGENVSIRPFVIQLLKGGYFLSDVHYHTNGNGYNTKYILSITFNRERSLIKFGKKTICQILRFIEKDAWAYCHFWKNPNGVWSVNCLHRIPPDQSKNINIGELFFDAPKNDGNYINEKI